MQIDCINISTGGYETIDIHAVTAVEIDRFRGYYIAILDTVIIGADLSLHTLQMHHPDGCMYFIPNKSCPIVRNEDFTRQYSEVLSLTNDSMPEHKLHDSPTHERRQKIFDINAYEEVRETALYK